MSMADFPGLDTANMAAEPEPVPPAPFHAPAPAQQQAAGLPSMLASMLSAALNNPNDTTAAAPTASKRPTFARPPAIHWFVQLVAA